MRKLVLVSFLMLFILLSNVMAQHLVSGKVTDESGEALISVNILEKGTSNGTVTDNDGNYQLTVNTTTSTIFFSYIGYETQEVKLKGEVELNIVMTKGIGLEDIQIVGSRSYKRTATESAVPVDIIDVTEVSSTSGRVEINQILQFVAPSFNATKQSGSDGADHIDPASLRGLGPDQTLVLINGKRRHQSSLVNVFGTRGRGNTGTDLNAIPVSSIKRIEVLRDGASAQYGSDAIAGVINIVLNDQTEGLTGGIIYGAYSTAVGEDYAQQIFDTQDGWEPELFNINGKNRIDGKNKKFDGNTSKIDLNYGLSLGEKGGFINITTEFLTKERTLRPSFDWRKGYGSAAVDQYQFMINAEIPLSENTDFYAFGGMGDRASDAYAFTRGAPGIDGDDRSVATLYPDGFSPRITTKISDNSLTGGFRHAMNNGWKVDFSNSFGMNDFHYFIKGTNNASLGSASPTNFDAGGHSLSMNVSSIDFTKYIEGVASGLNVAFGTEFRNESFKIYAGEEGSYAIYDENGIPLINPAIQNPFINEFGQQPTGGSQGFPGYSPENEVNESRSNIGFYGDVELNVTKEFLLSGAVRFEKYSDFGNTFNYKFSTRYELFDGFAVRASYSTGFRAPSLVQIHYNLLFNNIVAGASLRTLLASNTSTVAKAFGIEPLKQETAQNFAAGFTFKKGGLTATIDGYIIDVADRIILTDVFDASGLGVGAEAAQFFANGVDTRTSGLDIILNYNYFLNNDNTTAINFGIAGNFNNTEIQSINPGGLNEFIFFGPFSRAYLEAAAPDYKFTGSLGFKSEKLSAVVSWTQFSEVILQDFQWVDSPATNQAEADALYAVASDVYKAAGTLDASISYKFIKNLSLTIGANNILNTYPTPQFDGWTDQGGFNDSVLMGSDGTYVFARLGFNF